jgi:gliding motility-associated-like protein
MNLKKKLICVIAILFFLINSSNTYAQLSVRNAQSATQLAQMLVGYGVNISNATITGNLLQAGTFYSTNTPITYDSGFVITTGLAKTNGTQIGVNGGARDLTFGRASRDMNGLGNAQLNAIATGLTQDAFILEFDFVPLGDTVSFNYTFSSEEYPDYNCTDFNDIFAFFISGPGYATPKNIALIPGTNIPVTINTINSGIDGDPNDAVPCSAVFTNLFIDNRGGLDLSHNGLTVSLTAKAAVTPCQTYRLKIAIADVQDETYDSGVFLKAGSLNSNALAVNFSGSTTVATGQQYLAEGCVNGSLNFTLPQAKPVPTQYNITVSGTATNGVDYSLLPSLITIPANTTTFALPITSIADALAEGTETLNVYVSSSCANGAFLDSAKLLIFDYDTLSINPNKIGYVCAIGAPITLTASGGYTSYTWDANTTLSTTSTAATVATPTVTPTTYYCTAVRGTCQSRDSVTVLSKNILSQTQLNVLCKNGNEGAINIIPGPSFIQPLNFSINGGTPQLDSSFNNLTAGNYVVTLTDQTNCTRSYNFTITQAYPDLTFTETILSPICNTPGTITIIANGGRAPYTYSINGINYSTNNALSINAGNLVAFVRDANGCITSKNFTVVNTSTLAINNVATTNALCSTTATGTIIITVTGGQAPYQYSIDNGINFQNSNLFTVFEGTKNIVVKDGAGCIANSVATVLLTNDLIVNAGNDIQLCEGTSKQLNATSNALANVWTPNNTINNTTILTPTISPTSNITYVLTGTKGSCTKKDTINIMVLPAPVANAGVDATICYGQSINLNGAGGVQYNWQSNTTSIVTPTATPTVSPTNNSLYWLVVTDAFGCKSLNTDTVAITVTPPIIVKTNNDTFIAANQPLQLNTTGAPSYIWTPSLYLNNPNIANPIATMPNTGLQQYIVKGFTAAGCIGFDTININVYKGPEIYVPTTFTPNKDGINDVFKITAIGLQSFAYLKVFNRWGQLVYSSNSPNKTWDGTFKGKPVPTGTYVWAVEGTSYLGLKIQKRGTLIILQ